MCELDAPSILSRTSGYRLDPKTGRTYNLALATPDGKDPGLAARLEACVLTCTMISDTRAAWFQTRPRVPDMSFDMRHANLTYQCYHVQELPCTSPHLSQLQTRLHAHEAAEAELQTWFSRFPGLCVTVDAAESAAEVVSASSAIASGVLTAKAAGRAAEACSPCARSHLCSWLAKAVHVGKHGIVRRRHRQAMQRKLKHARARRAWQQTWHVRQLKKQQVHFY